MSDSHFLELWGAEARNSSVDSWVAGVIRSLANDVYRECLNLLLSFLPLHVSFSLGRTRGLSGVLRPSEAHREPNLVFELSQVYHIAGRCARGFVKKSEKIFWPAGGAFCRGFRWGSATGSWRDAHKGFHFLVGGPRPPGPPRPPGRWQGWLARKAIGLCEVCKPIPCAKRQAGAILGVLVVLAVPVAGVSARSGPVPA